MPFRSSLRYPCDDCGKYEAVVRVAYVDAGLPGEPDAAWMCSHCARRVQMYARILGVELVRRRPVGKPQLTVVK